MADGSYIKLFKIYFLAATWLEIKILWSTKYYFEITVLHWWNRCTPAMILLAEEECQSILDVCISCKHVHTIK